MGVCPWVPRGRAAGGVRVSVSGAQRAMPAGGCEHAGVCVSGAACAVTGCVLAGMPCQKRACVSRRVAPCPG